MIRLAIGLVLAGGALAYLHVPFAGVLVVFGVILFLYWLFTDGARVMR